MEPSDLRTSERLLLIQDVSKRQAAMLEVVRAMESAGRFLVVAHHWQCIPSGVEGELAIFRHSAVQEKIFSEYRAAGLEVRWAPFADCAVAFVPGGPCELLLELIKVSKRAVWAGDEETDGGEWLSPNWEAPEAWLADLDQWIVE